jgi:hypothetical protein
VAKTSESHLAPDVQAIVAEGQRRHGRSSATRWSARSSNDITRAPARLHESEMGNMVADAMRAEVPGRRRGVHELGRSPSDLVFAAAERR